MQGYITKHLQKRIFLKDKIKNYYTWKFWYRPPSLQWITVHILELCIPHFGTTTTYMEKAVKDLIHTSQK